MKRFWAKVTKSDGCWLWTASTSRYGYGKFSVGRRITAAHRVSWELANGPIPDGLFVLHRCDNPRCVRPEHLFLGTPADNSRDMVLKGRHRGGFRGATNSQAKLTDEDVREIRRLYESTRTLTQYSPGKITMDMLAERFGISHTAIFAVVHRTRWKLI